MPDNKIEELEYMVISMKNEISDMTIEDTCLPYAQNELELTIERDAKLAMLDWVLLAINEVKEK